MEANGNGANPPPPIYQPDQGQFIGVNMKNLASHPLTWGILIGAGLVLGFQAYNKSKRSGRMMRSVTPE